MNNPKTLENYYLLGCHFPLSRENGSITFPTWHLTGDVTGLEEVTNVRPILLTPVMANIEGDAGQLWASNRAGLLCNLGPGAHEANLNDSYEILRHSSPVHKLTEEQYQLSFPPLAILARLAQHSQDNKVLGKKIASVLNQMKGTGSLGSKFNVTTVALKQLAPAYKKKSDDSLTQEQQSYNTWLNEVQNRGEPIKGFLLPTVATCAVMFSHADYTNAQVTLQRFDVNEDAANKDIINNGQYTDIGSPTFATVLPDSDSNHPCALFNVDADSFENGYYSIKVLFDPDFNDGRIPDSIKESNIEKISDTVKTMYQYELREYIEFNQQTPMGKFAIVSGDMISLEETLIYQFPQYLSGIKQYLNGQQSESKAINSPALTSLATLNAIKDASGQLGMNLLSGSMNPDIEKGPKAVMNNVAKLYWEKVKNTELPDAMVATGELYFGIQNVTAAWTELEKMFTGHGTSELGSQALIKNYLWDSSKISKQLTDLKTAWVDKKYTVVSGTLANTWFGGVAGLAGSGIGLIGTGQNLYDLYSKAKQIDGLQKKAASANGKLEDIAYDYLDNIPVWNVHNKDKVKAIDDAISEGKKKLSTEKGDLLSFMNDERGAGIKLLFHFNSTEKEINDNKAIIDILSEAVKNEPNLRIRIEGHACQVDNVEINLKVSAARAENAKQAFPEALHTRIEVVALGESQPVVEAKGDAIDRNNKALQANRRVEIRIYLPTLNVVFHPSRIGSQTMERARLAAMIALNTQNKAEEELKLTVLQGIVDVASYLPLIGPAARGVLLIQGGGTVIKSAVSSLDAALFDCSYAKLTENLNRKKELVKLSRIHLDMLREVRNIDITLNVNVDSYQALAEFLSSDNTKKELLKRYKLRALATNGLMILIAHVANKSRSGDIKPALERYDVKGYINRYIARDDWSIDLLHGNNIATEWINQHDQKSRMALKNSFYNRRSLFTPQLEAHSKKMKLHRENNAELTSGQFNRVFPIQTNLFSNGEAKLFEEFAANFTPTQHDLTNDEIGFCRILVAEPNSNKWQVLTQWMSKSKSNRVTAFHKFKVQLILDRLDQLVFPAEIGYNRVDGIDIQGPKFELLFSPMRSSDFCCDPDNEIANYFKHKAEKPNQKVEETALTAIEFEPSYYFGPVSISGVKPITSKARIESLKAIGTLGLSLIFGDADANYTEYVKQGGFRYMRYVFHISNLNLPLHYSNSDENSDFYKNEFSVGVHGENSVTIPFYEGLNESTIKVSEVDVLAIPEFVYARNTGKAVVKPVIDNIAHMVVGLDSKESGLKLLSKTGPLVNFDWHNGSNSSGVIDFQSVKDSPTSLQVFIIGESNKSDYEKTLKLNWKKVNMLLQLGMDCDDKNTAGPSYNSDMHYIGDVKFSQYYANMNKTTNTNYSEWLIPNVSDSIIADNDELDLNRVGKGLSQIVHDLNAGVTNLDKDKTYAIYSMSFDLAYVSPTGAKINGLRPFGNLLSSKTPNLYISQLLQTNMLQKNVGQNTSYPLPTLKMALPKLYHGMTAVPWMRVGELNADNIDKQLANEWQAYSAKEKRELIKDWIENQSTVVDSPYPLHVKMK
ncbi:Putative uncharacterized protein [Moritella viscosa]|uniref:OmpA family protein n=1 Tax=Moritella viscosa TaxID=80854 RepID=UPI000508EA1F|nr:OmpA family protein [Moritella viscosa]CED60760.1 outer membrane protein, OmpA family [Moritella viscosa]SHO11880.1 Putative uncharacterized protein [Moritella viscosa]SHO22966.1 Putative uncharacterized protein [Moritella viscosa]